MKKKMMSRTVLGLLAVGLLTCHQVIFTAPPGSTLTLTVNPPFIPAHGGVAVVSALVMEEVGTPVPDGTVVQFFTSLGSIQEQGRTNDGVARVNLTSDSRSGTAKITAISGDAFDEDTVDIGAVLPTRVIVTADPPRINLAVSRTTHVFATVLDSRGNPVPNVPVIFRVTAPNTGTEFMQSGSNPLHTDNNGRVEDILRSQRAAGGTPGTITVEVTVLSANAITAGNTIQIPIQ